MKRRPVLITLALLLACRLTASLPRAQDAPPVVAVEAVGMTVADMDRSIDFYTRVLSFEKVSDTEVAGEDYQRPWSSPRAGESDT